MRGFTEGLREWIASLGFGFGQAAFQIGDFGFYIMVDGFGVCRVTGSHCYLLIVVVRG